MQILVQRTSTNQSKIEKSIRIPVWVAVLCLVAVGPAIVPVANAEGSGSAVVTVVTEPDIGGGTFRFVGSPSGELTLAPGEIRNLSVSGLPPGDHTSTLAEIDPMIVAAGYSLTQIRCDDGQSPRPSTGDIDNRTATFRIEDGETVSCTFVFSVSTCICPKEGRWNVANHTGSMVCTGAMSMTVPLKASSGSGTLEIFDGCARIIGSGMSEDEADLEMHLQDDCGYKGSVGGSYDQIPMVIDFTWVVENSERITGELHSTVTEQGMTCNMNRTYELVFSGP